MTTENPQVVRFHYSVAEVGQPPVENSREGGEPLAVLLGYGGIIPGLEKALMGRVAGEQFEVIVPAAEAYGQRNDNLIQRVPKKYIPERNPQPGQRVVLKTQDGPRAVTIIKVGQTVVDVDLNHPMAGKDLKFDIEMVDTRDATDAERSHGHAHGEGGHHHH
jgi:FKBP-type peptidyl-prolyl cis-trans isomerase SlyD